MFKRPLLTPRQPFTTLLSFSVCCLLGAIAAAPAQANSSAEQDKAVPSAADAQAAEETVQFSANFLAVGQSLNAGGTASGPRQSRWTYRADLSAELPTGRIGPADSRLFGHLRLGHGQGLTDLSNYASVNSTAGPRDAYATLAQLYYQLDWPLPGAEGPSGQPGRLLLNIGKMDFFGFFDQNSVAGDEASQFLNNAFVHNPLLDSGGDIAADDYGFAPGLRVGYFQRPAAALGWGASLGIFGAGNSKDKPAANNGARFSHVLKQPLLIAQWELSAQNSQAESVGNYRLYVWTNGGTTDLADQPERHQGWGVSADQRLGEHTAVFARLGRRTRGAGTFASALTLGLAYEGAAWGRSQDSVGLAWGTLRTSAAWQGATADGTLTGYAARGRERIAELYYRCQLQKNLAISPNLQWIQNPGGNGQAAAVRVLGLRANLGF